MNCILTCFVGGNVLDAPQEKAYVNNIFCKQKGTDAKSVPLNFIVVLPNGFSRLPTLCGLQCGATG